VTVKAFAPDSIQDNIKYSIFSGNEDGAFSLGSNSGNPSLPYNGLILLFNLMLSVMNTSAKLETEKLLEENNL
jgi:hypothetical protein